MPNTTWNVLDKHTRCTLSGSNLIATFVTDSTNHGGVRSTDGKTASGLYYVEITIAGNVSGNTCVGVCTQSPPWATANNSDLRGAYAYSGSSIFYNGSSSGFTLSGFTSGDVICIALDLGNSKVWFRKNGGNWDGNATHNPATNTGGISLSTLVATGRYWYIYGGAAAGASPAPVYTLNSGDTAFAQSVPSGFTSGWPTNGALATGSYFDAATKSSGVTLANTNFTASVASSGTVQYARAIGTDIVGKWYMEFLVNARSQDGGIGISDSNALATTLYTNATNGAQVYGVGGGVFVDGSSIIANNGALSNLAGDCVGVALDYSAKLIWFRVGTGNWNNNGSANPATGANGVDVSSMQGNMFPAISFQTSSITTISANTTDYPRLVVPSGFTCGWPPYVPQSPNRRSLIILG